MLGGWVGSAALGRAPNNPPPPGSLSDSLFPFGWGGGGGGGHENAAAAARSQGPAHFQRARRSGGGGGVHPHPATAAHKQGTHMEHHQEPKTPHPNANTVPTTHATTKATLTHNIEGMLP